jgi:hypothetical protein
MYILQKKFPENDPGHPCIELTNAFMNEYQPEDIYSFKQATLH